MNDETQETTTPESPSTSTEAPETAGATATQASGDVATQSATPEPAAAPAAAPAPAAPTAPTATQSLSTEYVSEVLELCRMGGLSMQTAESYIAEGREPALIRREILERQEAATQSADRQLGVAPPTVPGGVQVVREEGAKALQGVEEAIEYRAGIRTEPTELGRQYAGASLAAMAADCLRVRGVRDAHLLGAYEIARQALNSGATRDDFPKALENVSNKALQRAYQLAGGGWRAFARRNDSPDFRPRKSIQLHSDGQMLEVLEGGEFKNYRLREGRESYSLSTYGAQIGITRQMVVDDDLGVFQRIAPMFGQAAAYTENAIVWALITDPVVLEDGVALYHANHNNTSALGALTKANLGTARANMRLQQDLGGAYVAMTPRVLAVPEELWVTARELITDTTPNAAGDVNVFASGEGALSQVVSSPFLSADSATSWYLFADPAIAPTVEYSHLRGGPDGPTIERAQGVAIDGVQWHVRHDFGAGAVEYRSTYQVTT